MGGNVLFGTLLIIAGIVIILAFILTITVVPRRQQNSHLDKGIAVTTKNPIIANPIYISYAVLFAVWLIVLLYYYIV